MPPKKTSKTAHVLNLIAPGDEDAYAGGAVEDSADNLSSIAKTGDNIDLSSQQKTDIESEVNSAVAAALREELKGISVNNKDANLNEIPAKTIGVMSESKTNNKESGSDIMEENNTGSVNSTFNESDFITVNIVEDIIKSKAPDFVRKFGACDCHRCVSDIIALALNELPSRYTVTYKGMLFSKISSYENQHVVDISQALTKACMLVSDSPRHHEPITGD